MGNIVIEISSQVFAFLSQISSSSSKFKTGSYALVDATIYGLVRCCLETLDQETKMQ